MELNESIKKLIKDSKLIINKNIYLTLYILFLNMFIKKDNSSSKTSSKICQNLNTSINKINNKIIKNKKKYINMDYSTENFDNIISFVIYQNKLYAGEILEGLLISVFSFAFYSDKDNTFGKYIYSNLCKIKDSTNLDIIKMFKEEKFVPNELKNLKNLILKDYGLDEMDKINQQKNIVLSNLLNKIFILKYIHTKDEKDKTKTMYYINKGKSDNEKLSNSIYNSLGNKKKGENREIDEENENEKGNITQIISDKEKEETILDKDILSNSIMNIASNIFFQGEFGRIQNIPIKLIRSFFIQVFIYYQNKHSTLMNYIKEATKEEPNCVKIPFNYNLMGACIEGRFAYIALSPIRIEPRIEKISLAQNNFRECGMNEIGKIILFNKNIKSIGLNVSLIRTNYLEYLNIILGLFNDFSVENLNLSFNYLKDNCEEYLTKLLSHFREIKTINLTANELKGGIASFLVMLKKLYRKGKMKLENLQLNKCLLDEKSYYELGELLKCKYCKLKNLYLNFNYMPANINFLKKLKKNKSLTKIFLNKNEISNNNLYEVMKVICNTNIGHLYLYRNKISNPNEFLRLLYRTKIIKDNDNNNIVADESYLTNIDLSNNELSNKNYIHIKLLTNIIKESSLNCLEISHILYGVNPDKRKVYNENIKYRKNVEELKKYLDDKNLEYIKDIKKIRENTVDINYNKQLENDEELKIINKDDISTVIINEKAKYPVFLKKETKKLMNKYFPDIKDKKDEKYINLRNKIENYLVLKRAQKDLIELKEKEKANKLIII